MTALKSILVMALAVAVVGGALAVAQPSGDGAAKRGGGKAQDGWTRYGPLGHGERHGPHARLAGELAKKLGVTPRELRQALREVRAENRGCGAKDAALAQQLGITVERLREAKAKAGRRGLAAELGITEEKLREAMKAAREQRCTDMTNSFAQKLGKTGDEVRAAVKELAAEKLAAAVKKGRLSEERAARIRERVGSSPCFGLPLGHHRFGHRGFHRGHRFHRFHRRGFRDRGERGERREGSFEGRRGGRIPA